MKSGSIPFLLLVFGALLVRADADTGMDVMPGQEHESIQATGEYWYWRGVFYLELGGKNRATGRRFLEKSAEMGFAPAMNQQASAYLNGHYGYPQDLPEARRLLKMGSEAGDGYAMVNYAQCLYEGWGGRKDSEAAASWARKSLEADTAYYEGEPGPAFLGQLTEEEQLQMASVRSSVSLDVDEDPVSSSKNDARTLPGFIAADAGREAEAAAYFIEAANLREKGRAGNAVAAFEASRCLAMGHGVESDFDRAVDHLRLARAIEEANAARMATQLYHLLVLDQMDMDDFGEDAQATIRETYFSRMRDFGSRFADEESDRFDPVEAEEWYRLAASEGDWSVLPVLGGLYLNSDYKTFSPEKARAWFRKGWEEGDNSLAGLNYALCLLGAIGGEADEDSAEGIFEALRDTLFAANLPFRGEELEPPVTEAGLLEIDRQWAEDGDAEAEYFYGYRLEHGLGLQANRVRAESWYEKAIEKGHPGAMIALAGILIERHSSYSKTMRKRILELLERAREAGNPEALRVLADFKRKSDPVRSLFEIIRLLERYLEAVPDSPQGLTSYARAEIELLDSRYFEGDPEGRDSAVKRVLDSLLQAGEQDYAPSLVELGRIYLAGELVKQDKQKALFHYQKAADLGYRKAARSLAVMYRDGEGTPVDADLAAYYYRRVIENEDLFAESYRTSVDALLSLYLDGSLSFRNPDLFRYWIFLKSKWDTTGSYMMLSDFLMQEEFYTEAIELFNEMKILEIKQTENLNVGGDAVAFTYADPAEGLLRGRAYSGLGRCYGQGLGVDKDEALAGEYYARAITYGNADGFFHGALEALNAGEAEKGLRYLRLAADRGSADACFELGTRILSGESGAQAELGMYYLRQAAEFSHREAMLFLAGSFLRELPGAPTLDEALQYALRARNLGSDRAIQLVRKLEALKEKLDDRGGGSSFFRRLG